MDATCNQDFLNKSCVCIADALDPWANICAFIDRNTGYVYPCNPGCCVPRCQNTGPSQNLQMELHRTGGVALPPGFGAADASTSTSTTSIGKGVGAPIDQAKEPIFSKQSKISSTRAEDFIGPQDPSATQVWAMLARLLVFIAIIFISAGFLD